MDLRFRETCGEGLSPQEPVFRLRSHSPGVLALPLLGDLAAPQDWYKHRDGGAPYSWSAFFSPRDRAEDFLKHKPIIPPTSTHPHSIFLKLFHPRVKSSAHHSLAPRYSCSNCGQRWDETPLPPGLLSPWTSGTQEAHPGSGSGSAHFHGLWGGPRTPCLCPVSGVCTAQVNPGGRWPGWPTALW